MPSGKRRRLQFQLVRTKKRGEIESIVSRGVGGIGFVHTTTVRLPSRAKRLFSIAGFGLKGKSAAPRPNAGKLKRRPFSASVTTRLKRPEGVEGAIRRVVSGNGDDLFDIPVGGDDFYRSTAIDGEMEASIGGEGHAVGANSASDAGTGTRGEPAAMDRNHSVRATAFGVGSRRPLGGLHRQSRPGHWENKIRKPLRSPSRRVSRWPHSRWARCGNHQGR